MRTSSLCGCSAWFEGTSFIFVIFTEGIKNGHLKNGKTDAYAEHTHQFLLRMLSMRTSSLWVCSACTSVPDAFAQRTHKGRSILVSKSPSTTSPKRSPPSRRKKIQILLLPSFPFYILVNHISEFVSVIFSKVESFANKALVAFNCRLRFNGSIILICLQSIE